MTAAAAAAAAAGIVRKNIVCIELSELCGSQPKLILFLAVSILSVFILQFHPPFLITLNYCFSYLHKTLINELLLNIQVYII
jgi:hypothetical protein